MKTWILKKIWQFRTWHLKRQLYKMAHLLHTLDDLFKANGIKRQERRQFWREFYTRSEMLKGILDAINWDK